MANPSRRTTTAGLIVVAVVALAAAAMTLLPLAVDEAPVEPLAGHLIDAGARAIADRYAGADLPTSDSEIDFEPKTYITIAGTDLLLNGEKVIELTADTTVVPMDAGSAKADIIDPLHDRLKEEARKARRVATSDPTRPFEGHIQLVADKNTRFDVIISVLKSAAYAGFDRPFVAVRNDVQPELGITAVRVSTPWTSTGLRHEPDVLGPCTAHDVILRIGDGNLQIEAPSRVFGPAFPGAEHLGAGAERAMLEIRGEAGEYGFAELAKAMQSAKGHRRLAECAELTVEAKPEVELQTIIRAIDTVGRSDAGHPLFPNVFLVAGD